MRNRGADIDDACLLELEGEPSPDEDFDADEGAMLIIPRAIVAVREPERDACRRQLIGPACRAA